MAILGNLNCRVSGSRMTQISCALLKALTMERSVVAASLHAWAAQISRADKSFSQKQLNILAVDDDPFIVMSVVDMLEDLGHTECAAGSGIEALDKLRTTKFDLLITDHSMPRMTGAQLAEKIIDGYGYTARCLHERAGI